MQKVSLRSTGNLGNQMFQYTAARYISLKNNNASITTELGGDFKTDWLADFKAPHSICNKSQRTLAQLIFRNALHFIRYALLKQDVAKIQAFQKPLQPFLNKLGIYYYSYGYYPFAKSENKNLVVEGYFETPKYANEIKSVVIDDFTPIHEPLAHNLYLYEKIENTNSVCISVRRGDFVTGENNASAQDCNVCTMQYFACAIEYCKANLKNPVFFVFSDDINWVKNNLNLGESEAYYETGNDPVWEKLRLMYTCKNFIIANSTFSWWAQYLSKNEDKLVVAPSRWRNNSINTEIYEDKWVLLSPDELSVNF